MPKVFFPFIFIIAAALAFSSCRERNAEAVTVALSDKFSTFDTLTTEKSDAAAERIRNLMFNSLIRKDENFDYIGELAQEITTSEDGKKLTLTLRDGVKFHNGQELTSADVKYTFDELFSSNGYKSSSFYDPPVGPPSKAVDAPKDKGTPHIGSLETPDGKTVVFNLARPSLKQQLLANLVTIAIIPTGSVAQQKDSPVGSGPFKFVSFDQSQNIVELAANADYWEGAPKIEKLRVKTVTDANSLQAELQSGAVDIAPQPSNLLPDTIKALAGASNLKVEQFDGSNIQYLVLNTESAPLNNPKVRQAIAYAIDRDKIVKDLFFDQAKVADSILPTTSWAYTTGTKYTYDTAKAKSLLEEAGYKNEPVVFKFTSGNAAVSQYAQVIQSSLTDAGLNVQIETLEGGTIRQQLAQGQYQIFTGVWVGGNQDPMFLRDLFSSTKIPGGSVSCCNRSRYKNDEVDKTVADAFAEADREKAKAQYVRTWELVSDDVPLFPLWYPANIVISTKRIGNVKVNGSGDWIFLKDVTVSK
jgi:peptide/nickel transport system substrate-binding protein